MIRLKVPCSLEYRDLAMRLVAAACKLAQAQKLDGVTGGWQDPDFDDHVISAFGEAFNNVVLHGANPDGSELEVEIEPYPDHLTIRLLDYGRSFDMSSVPIPDLEKLHESGMGLYIIRTCMDDVAYEPGRPNVLTMTRYDGRGSNR
jgi:serine/threonine-protein kinase RsbW